jgi:hypothetical protein
MDWSPRKNAKQPTSTNLRDSASEIALSISNLTAEAAGISQKLPGLIMEPDRAIEASNRLQEIETRLPHLRRQKEVIEAAIPDAEKREAIEDFTKRRAEQARKSEKLSRTIRDRYLKSAEPMIALFEEIEADRRACEAISDQAHALGLVGLWHAEYTGKLRDSTSPTTVYGSITEATLPPWLWGGGPLWPRPHTSVGMFLS